MRLRIDARFQPVESRMWANLDRWIPKKMEWKGYCLGLLPSVSGNPCQSGVTGKKKCNFCLLQLTLLLCVSLLADVGNFSFFSVLFGKYYLPHPWIWPAVHGVRSPFLIFFTMRRMVSLDEISYYPWNSLASMDPEHPRMECIICSYPLA